MSTSHSYFLLKTSKHYVGTIHNMIATENKHSDLKCNKSRAKWQPSFSLLRVILIILTYLNFVNVLDGVIELDWLLRHRSRLINSSRHRRYSRVRVSDRGSGRLDRVTYCQEVWSRSSGNTEWGLAIKRQDSNR